MGDRVLIVFASGADDISPAVYLHWGGSDAPHLIEETAKHMATKKGDAQYAAARCIGLAHAHDAASNTGLGVTAPPADLKEETLKKFSHGDAGVVVVDASTFEWKAFGGYLRHDKRAKNYVPRPDQDH